MSRWLKTFLWAALLWTALAVVFATQLFFAGLPWSQALRENGAHLHRALIGSLEASLDPRQFVRIHRSAIVNIDLVSELRQDAHGDYVAVLRGGPEVRVGRRFRERLQERLGQSL